MNKPPQIIFRDPADLKIHPALKHMPGEWAKGDPRFLSLCDDIGDRGLDEAIKIIAGTLIVVDGRHRLRGAKRQQLKEIPCVEVAESEAMSVMVQSKLQRQHFTPGQRAYVVAPLMDEAFAEAQKRMFAGVKATHANSVRGVKTVDAWADEIGCSRRLLEQAREVHEHFKNGKKFPWNDIPDSVQELYPDEKKLTLSEYFEPQIMAELKPIGLGNALQGIGFKLKNTEPDGTTTKQVKSGQLELFGESINSLFLRASKIKNIADVKTHISAAVSEIKTDADLERLLAVAKEIEKQINARRREMEKESA